MTQYEGLSSGALEQAVAEDLRRALGPRGCDVVGLGTQHSPAPGGGTDIEIRDDANRRLILVELTSLTGNSAEGQYVPAKTHLDDAIARGGYDDYGLLYISPATPPRLRAAFNDSLNAPRQREGKAGRAFCIDLAGLALVIDAMTSADASLYPADRLGELLKRWEEATDDARAREIAVRTLLAEDTARIEAVTEETRKEDAAREQRLGKQLVTLENKLRDKGITGSNANTTLVYLAFLRLYEEKRTREKGGENRFTAEGFRRWRSESPESQRQEYDNRMVECLLHEVATESRDLHDAGLLRRKDEQRPTRLHEKLDDTIVLDLVLPVFDQYTFIGTRLDVLGVVFETLARRGGKDTRVGQFFTPQEVVDFCVAMVNLRPTDLVLDPAVGTARFPVAAMRQMLASARKQGREAELGNSIRQHQLLGSDLDGWIATIAKMNMYFNGDGKSNMVNANGLILGDRSVFSGKDDGIADKIDVVLTNPPLGDTSFVVAADDWVSKGGAPDKRGNFWRGLSVVPVIAQEEVDLAKQVKRLDEIAIKIEDAHTIQSSSRRQKRLQDLRQQERDALQKQTQSESIIASGQATWKANGTKMKGGALFLGAISHYLKPVREPDAPVEWRGGQAMIVVDEAILTSRDLAPVRDFIRRESFVKAVISLGRQAFQYLAHTDAKTSIVYLVRKHDVNLRQREPVFYAHAERVGYSRTGRWIGSDLPDVLRAFHSVRDAILGNYHGATYDTTIAANMLQCLVGYAREWHLQEIGSSDERLDYYHARAIDLEAELRLSGAVCLLGDLIDPRPRQHPKRSRTGEYLFGSVDRNALLVRPKGIEPTKYEPKDLWMMAAGDIVVSGIDLVHGAVAVATEAVAGAVMSKEMYAYTVREGAAVLPEYVTLLLQSAFTRAMLYGRVSGTSNRTRLDSAEQLLNLPIPSPPPISAQRQAVEQLLRSHTLLEASRECLQDARSTVEGTMPTVAIAADVDAAAEDVMKDEEEASEEEAGN